MKKSNLRKIIRESIKQLMNEQLSEPVTITKTYGCCLPNAMNYQSDLQGSGCQNCGCVMAGPGGINDVAGYITGNDIPENNNSCPFLAYSGPTTTMGCNENGMNWGNQLMWQTNFSNIVSNHNNPCAFLQSRMDTWMQNIGNVGSNQANQLACKIKYIQTQLWPQYNCQ